MLKPIVLKLEKNLVAWSYRAEPAADICPICLSDCSFSDFSETYLRKAENS